MSTKEFSKQDKKLTKGNSILGWDYYSCELTDQDHWLRNISDHKDLTLLNGTRAYFFGEFNPDVPPIIVFPTGSSGVVEAVMNLRKSIEELLGLRWGSFMIYTIQHCGLGKADEPTIAENGARLIRFVHEYHKNTLNYEQPKPHVFGTCMGAAVATAAVEASCYPDYDHPDLPIDRDEKDHERSTEVPVASLTLIDPWTDLFECYRSNKAGKLLHMFRLAPSMKRKKNKDGWFTSHRFKRENSVLNKIPVIIFSTKNNSVVRSALQEKVYKCATGGSKFKLSKSDSEFQVVHKTFDGTSKWFIRRNRAIVTKNAKALAELQFKKNKKGLKVSRVPENLKDKIKSGTVLWVGGYTQDDFSKKSFQEQCECFYQAARRNGKIMFEVKPKHCKAAFSCGKNESIKKIYRELFKINYDHLEELQDPIPDYSGACGHESYNPFSVVEFTDEYCDATAGRQTAQRPIKQTALPIQQNVQTVPVNETPVRLPEPAPRRPDPVPEANPIPTVNNSIVSRSSSSGNSKIWWMLISCLSVLGLVQVWIRCSNAAGGPPLGRWM